MPSLLDEMFKENSKPISTKTDVEKCARDLKSFALTYFPHIFYKPLSTFHDDMFSDAQSLILDYGDTETYFVRAAPRSFGKSRIISVVFPLWCVCYSYRKNLLLLSDTNPQAKEYIQAIKYELENNEKLKSDFGALSGKDIGKIWREDEIVTANEIHIFSKGAGQSLRGSSFNSCRPEVVVLDRVLSFRIVGRHIRNYERAKSVEAEMPVPR